MKHHLIQIAGVIDQSEAALLAESDIDYLGFPLRLDVHEEDLSESDAATIIRCLPPQVRAVLITYLNEAEPVAELCRHLGCNIVQLHGDICTSEVLRLRSRIPGIEIVKSLIVRDTNNVDVLTEAVTRFSPYVDAFITDTFDPFTRASGATGKTHDWSISRRLVHFSERPVILAGGLRPENVGEAIRFVRPAGVDVHTGVEREDGRKDAGRVKEFVNQARTAFNSL